MFNQMKHNRVKDEHLVVIAKYQNTCGGYVPPSLAIKRGDEKTPRVFFNSFYCDNLLFCGFVCPQQTSGHLFDYS